MFWAFQKSIFQLFANFWVTKLKPFSWNMRQTIQNYFNQTLVIGNFLENGFEATLSWKANVLSAYKCHFSVFPKALRDKVPTFFSKPERKRSELSKSKLGHMNLLEKWFWSYLELKKECCGRLKKSFFSFCTFLSDEVETIFWERETERLIQFKSKFVHRKLLIKLFCSYLELKNEVS